MTGRSNSDVRCLALDAIFAILMVAAAYVAGYALQQLGDRRITLVYLLPVVFSGYFRGLTAANIAAIGALLIYLLVVIPPSNSLVITTFEDGVAVGVFGLCALVTGYGAGHLREEAWRVAGRSRLILAVIESNTLFTTTPNETAIHQHLTDMVASTTGHAALLSSTGADQIMALAPGSDVEDQVLPPDIVRIVHAAVSALRRRSQQSGPLRARTIAVGEQTFGVMVWTNPRSSPQAQRELDESVEVLLEIGASALLRVRRDRAVKPAAITGTTLGA